MLKKYFHKNISKIYFFLLSVFAFSARVAGAQCGTHLSLFCNPLASKTNSIAESLALVALYLLSVAGIITLTFMVIAGVRYIISAGNPEKMKSAKDAFFSTGSGLVIIILSYAILSIIHGILNA
ncbi:MAG: hypothetical protein U9N04_04325 [Patescibacteria group bacterium]|nr:hypothetical protein [Patescibacteria group bacterium]